MTIIFLFIVAGWFSLAERLSQTRSGYAVDAKFSFEVETMKSNNPIDIIPRFLRIKVFFHSEILFQVLLLSCEYVYLPPSARDSFAA